MRRLFQIMGLVAALLATAAFFQIPTPTPTAEPGEEPLYVIIVMDYSPSIDLPIGKEIPLQLAELASKLKTVADNPDYIAAVKTVNEQFKTRPDVVKAKKENVDTNNAMDEWMADHGYEAPYTNQQSKFNTYMTEIGCEQAGSTGSDTTINPLYMSYFTPFLPPTPVTMDQIVAMVEQLCRLDNVTLTPEQKSQVQAMLAFLADPEYLELAQARYESNNAMMMLTTDLVSNPQYTNALQEMNALAGGSEDAFLTLSNEVMARSYDAGIPTGLSLASTASQIMGQVSVLDERATGRETSEDFVAFHYEVLEIVRDYGLSSFMAWVSELYYRGGNNMGEALEKAIDNMPEEHRDQPALIILLDAGAPNVGMTSEEILSTIPTKARERNVTICSMGLGSQESDTPAALLKGLAEQTGGRYLHVSGEDAGPMMGFIVACRQSLISDILQQFTGTIKQDETIEAGRITVGTSEQMNVTLTYMEGRVSMNLVDPSGRAVDTSYQGATNLAEVNTQVVTISDPQPGDWVVRLSGDEVPDTGTVYSVVASADRAPGTPWWVWAVIVLVILGAIGAAAYFFRDRLLALVRKAAVGRSSHIVGTPS